MVVVMSLADGIGVVWALYAVAPCMPEGHAGVVRGAEKQAAAPRVGFELRGRSPAKVAASLECGEDSSDCGAGRAAAAWLSDSPGCQGWPVAVLVARRRR